MKEQEQKVEGWMKEQEQKVEGRMKEQEQRVERVEEKMEEQEQKVEGRLMEVEKEVIEIKAGCIPAPVMREGELTVVSHVKLAVKHFLQGIHCTLQYYFL